MKPTTDQATSDQAADERAPSYSVEVAKMSGHPRSTRHTQPVPSQRDSSRAAASSAKDVFERAAAIRMHCGHCGRRDDLPTPVDLDNVRCAACGAPWDLVELRDGRPVHHGQMQQLIELCYRQPAFAKKIALLYARDHARSLNQEWTIDKPLLACHAAQALAVSGHRSFLAFLSLPLGATVPAGGMFLPPIGALIPIMIAASGVGRGPQWARRHLRRDSYDPSAIAARRVSATESIVEDLDLREPETLHFGGSANPFKAIGLTQGAWSILVDRRRREDGTTADEAAPLDLQDMTTQMLDHLTGQSRDSGASGVYSRTFETFVDSRCVEASHEAILDDELNPQPDSRADTRSLEEIGVCRRYNRVTYYDRARNLGYTTLFRLADRGPFTQLEVVGVRTLPLVRRLFNRFDLGQDVQETTDRFRTPRLWFGIPSFWRSRIKFAASSLLAVLVVWWLGAAVAIEEFWEAERPEAVLLANGPIMLLLLLLIGATCAKGVRIENLYKSRLTWPAPFRLLQRRHERARLRRLAEIRLKKELRNFDYSPARSSLRIGQSKASPTGYFEQTHVELIRQSHNLAIQDCFLSALQRAGIDTSDFRQGLAQVNNYGVINSGDVKGGITTSGGTEESRGTGPRRRAVEGRSEQ